MLRNIERSSPRITPDHLVNYKPIILCTISLIVVGVLMIAFGIVALLLDHVEMGPPHFDTEYNRYSGSSLVHILGKLR